MAIFFYVEGNLRGRSEVHGAQRATAELDPIRAGPGLPPSGAARLTNDVTHI